MKIARSTTMNAVRSLRFHWPEYLMEAAELALYLFVTCVVMTLFQHPASPIHKIIPAGIWRRMLAGLVMGITAIGIVMSPWGRQSGAHFNPAVTFTFYRLGKVQSGDAAFYIAAQFLGAIGGVALATYLLRGAPANQAVRYAVTAPGVYGKLTAFIAEVTISFISMSTVLFVSNTERTARYTPYFAGVLIATYITLETPLSGMSMNPARTFGSAFHARYWHSLWIYFIAPTLGMLSAAEVFLRVRKGAPPLCAKLYHSTDKRCIFNCGYLQRARLTLAPASSSPGCRADSRDPD
jgi:aquaporin Z